MNVSGDPRNYILQNRLRFDTPDNHRDNGHPLELDVLLNHKDRIVSNKGTNYPTLKQIKLIKNSLESSFDNLTFAAIGFYNISKENLQIHIDGVAIKVNDETDISDVKQWCENNLSGQKNSLIRYDELQCRDTWVRIWCD